MDLGEAKAADRKALASKLEKENPRDKDIGRRFHDIRIDAVVSGKDNVWLQLRGDSFVFHGGFERLRVLDKFG